MTYFIKACLSSTLMLGLWACGGGEGESQLTVPQLKDPPQKIVATYGIIKGTVATGLPVANTKLTFTDSIGMSATVVTDQDGTYALPNPGFTPPIVVSTATLSGTDYTKLASGTAELKSTQNPLGIDTVNVTPATSALIATIIGKSIDTIEKIDITKINPTILANRKSELNKLVKKIKETLEVNSEDFINDQFFANQRGIDRIFDTFKFETESEKIIITSREGYKQAKSSDNSGSYLVTPFDWLALNGESVKKIVVSNYHACALLMSEKVYCWGKNNNGYLGNGSYVDSPEIPVRAGNLEGVVDITTEDSGWTCALLIQGTVYCWGSNGGHGEFGAAPIGGAMNAAYKNVPTLLNFLTNVSAISLTNNGASCALLSNGALTCWGDNGNPFDISVDTIGSKAIKFSAGGTSSCVILEIGVVKCFGWNNTFGELGNTVASILPNSSGRKIATVQLKSDISVVDVAAGLYYGCALFKDGSVQCWGRNNVGQLGNKSLVDSPYPVNVTFEKSVASISASATHACAILSDGLVQCWGRNDYGQLGISASKFVGDGAQSVAISNLPVGNTCMNDTATSLSLAYYSSCVLTSKGHFQCWGSPGNSRATAENPTASSCEGKSSLNLNPF